MKTRIVRTSIHDNKSFKLLSINSKYLLLFLMSCKHCTVTHLFRIPNLYLSADTGMSVTAIQKTIKELSNSGLLFYHEEWFGFPKKYSYIISGNRWQKANYESQLSEIPKSIINVYNQWVMSGPTTSCITSHTTSPMTSVNKQITNNKQQIVNKKQINIDHVAILSKWNAVRSEKRKSLAAFEDNIQHWLKEYTVEDICKAIENVQLSPWHNKAMTIGRLFNKKNKAGPCDYIGDLLNVKTEGVIDGKAKASPEEIERYKNTGTVIQAGRPDN